MHALAHLAEGGLVVEAGAPVAVTARPNLEEERAVDLVLLSAEDAGQEVCHGPCRDIVTPPHGAQRTRTFSEEIAGSVMVGKGNLPNAYGRRLRYSIWPASIGGASSPGSTWSLWKSILPLRNCRMLPRPEPVHARHNKMRTWCGQCAWGRADWPGSRA